MSDEQTSPQPIKDRTLRQRLLICGIYFAFALLLAYFAVRIVLAAWPLQSGWLLGVEIPGLLISALMLALAIWLVTVPVSRKIRTGKFLLSRAETLQKSREGWSKLGAGKPLRPQLWFVLLPLLGSVFLIWFGGLVVSLGWCGCAPTKFRDMMLMVLGGMLICGGLVYPFIAIRRKLRTGYFLPSEEDFAKGRARCAEPKPLRTRIFLAAIWWFNAALWTYSAIDHIRHPSHHISSPPWVAAGASCLAAALWTLQVFRPRASQCALPLDDNESSSIEPKDSGPQFKLL